jgi:hypothetical protein
MSSRKTSCDLAEKGKILRYIFVPEIDSKAALAKDDIYSAFYFIFTVYYYCVNPSLAITSV